VKHRLRAHGLRRGARGRRARPSYGWESLTPTELRVVDLAVLGRTTREIAEQLYISRNTVETHLKHIYRKLGVASRIQLAAAATRR
jgi:DNA-binding CsgD family transcriptional regulator